jgi:spermidine/putrescine transport system permease protein
MGLGMAAMILGNATLVLPYVYITVKARLVGMDPSIEEASMDLGASRSYTFLHVTLPAILPGAVSGAFMAFTLALGDLVICSFLADATTVTLPIKVYSQLKRGIKPEINALSTLILLAFALGIGGWMGIGQAKKRKGLMMAKREEKKELAALESSKAA